MTVAEAGKREGRVLDVVREAALDSDAPELEFSDSVGEVHSDLSTGVNVTSVRKLISNTNICHDGVKLHGAGFIVSPSEANMLGLGIREGLENYIRPYRNGRDLAARKRGLMVIDLFGLTEPQVRKNLPEVYQHLLISVRPDRELQAKKSGTKDAKAYAEKWWIFGKPRTELRPALADISKYIATVDTSAHRLFQFLPTNIVCDDKVVLIASEAPFHLGILSSRNHLAWALRLGGWLGAGNDSVYVKSKVFDPFPFPDASPEQKQRIGALAEELDAVRKQVLEAHADLTLTGLYNLRDKVRKGEPLDIVEQDQRQRGLIDLICELHDRIDGEVADAYGWPRDLSDEDIVARLVALNAERHAEEQRGIVRWLRPEYQIPKAGVVELKRPEPGTQIEALLPDVETRKPPFPRDAIGQTATVIDALRAGAADAEAIARRFSQGMKVARRVQATLDALERLGHVHRAEGAYALRKVA